MTALIVGRWCSYYWAQLIAPIRKDIVPTQKSGVLPETLSERETFICELVTWIFAHSNPPDLFGLWLDDHPLSEKRRVAKFDHHDDSCCWVLNLSESEFEALQDAWQAHGLPTDLFYSEGKQICVPYPGKGWKARLLRAFGWQRCYTPKQWERETLT
ncbi:MAG: hypothetical protein RML93_12015 [Anaerolineales bacterium]|nr:hypothetical protein [Anaerolineales bacterium]MCS7247579.1 hypothetical protein [Anaerolineales bacterium]MDW8161390.1 hypothetical protein [Anaerolineales bacterium]MDW8447999.1 hypothetical protein [Anaerolineales bacterium]